MRRVQELRAEEVRTVIRESDTNTELSTARIAESDFRIQDTWGRQIYSDTCFKFLYICIFFTPIHFCESSMEGHNNRKDCSSAPSPFLPSSLPACLLAWSPAFPTPVCLPAWRFACMSALLPALYAFSLACLLRCLLLAWLVACLPYQSACLPAWRLACMSARLSALSAFSPSCLIACLSYQSACLPDVLPACLLGCLPGMPSCLLSFLLFTCLLPECRLLAIRISACQFICVVALMFIRYEYMEPAWIHIEITNLSIHSARRQYCMYGNVRVCKDFLYIVHMTVLQEYQHYY